jgi:hypothetical protein
MTAAAGWQGRGLSKGRQLGANTPPYGDWADPGERQDADLSGNAGRPGSPH